MRLVDADLVADHLTHDLAFEAMYRAFTMEAGLAGIPGRIGITHDGGRVRMLAAAVDGLGVFGHKIIAVTGEHSVRFTITLFDSDTGAMRAIVDGDAISAHRTAATTALATDLLCRRDVDVAAIIGTGAVASSHLIALDRVRPTDTLRVFSPNREHRDRFVSRHQHEVSSPLVAVSSVDEAVAGAGLVTLATKSESVVLEVQHLAAGVHVNSVGAVRPVLREVEPTAFPLFDRVVCDSVDLVFAHCGDAMAAAAGEYVVGVALGLAAIVSGSPPRRPGETTLFKSAGTAIQDLTLAAAIVDAVEADGGGVEVPDPVRARTTG